MTGDPAVSQGGASCPDRAQVGGAPAGRSGTVHTQLMLSSTRAGCATAPNLRGQAGDGQTAALPSTGGPGPAGPRPPPPPTPSGPGACNLEQRPSIHVSNRCRGRHSEGTPGESEVPLPTSTQQCNKGVRCSDNTDKRKCRPWAAGVLRKGDGPDAAWTVLNAKAQARSGTIPPGGQGSLVLPGTDSAGCRARTGSVLGSP